MAIFTIELDGKLIKQINAEDFFDKGEMIYFTDNQNANVGSVVKRPGMTVIKQEHEHRDFIG
ncbi:MAG: hypothetical protein ABSG10_01015 [Terracidiphilus sp.]